MSTAPSIQMPTPRPVGRRLLQAAAVVLAAGFCAAPALAASDDGAVREGCPLDAQACEAPASSKPEAGRGTATRPTREGTAGEVRNARSRWQSLLPGMMK
jgi:hypothetical protein